MKHYMELICTDRYGLRRVNDLETEALEFTFEQDVGRWLKDIIEVRYQPYAAERGALGFVRNETYIEMRSDYDPEGLGWIGVFIHEAVHIWQWNTNCFRDFEKDYTYYVEQLPNLMLKAEEHASAVQDWFIVKFGIEHEVFNTEARIQWAWNTILPTFTLTQASWEKVAGLERNLANLEFLIEIWDPVIEDIRRPEYARGSKCELKEPDRSL